MHAASAVQYGVHTCALQRHPCRARPPNQIVCRRCGDSGERLFLGGSRKLPIPRRSVPYYSACVYRPHHIVFLKPSFFLLPSSFFLQLAFDLHSTELVRDDLLGISASAQMRLLCNASYHVQLNWALISCSEGS